MPLYLIRNKNGDGSKMDKTPEPGELEPWTQRETNLLHEMVRDYDRARWLKGQLRWWAIWVLGLPAFVLTIWEPVARLWKLLKAAFGHGID